MHHQHTSHCTRGLTPKERLEHYTPERPEDACWPWTGSLSAAGYPVLAVNKRQVKGHRLAYEVYVGPLIGGLTIDHLCKNPACTNPAHLEQVTPRVNSYERSDGPWAVNGRRTHCVNGHEFTPENTALRQDGRRRRCIACSVAAGAESNRKKLLKRHQQKAANTGAEQPNNMKQTKINDRKEITAMTEKIEWPDGIIKVTMTGVRPHAWHPMLHGKQVKNRWAYVTEDLFRGTTRLVAYVDGRIVGALSSLELKKRPDVLKALAHGVNVGVVTLREPRHDGEDVTLTLGKDFEYKPMEWYR